MISDSLQERIHRGDREAFRALYSEYSRDVYLTAQECLTSDALARAVVKQVFLRIHRELLDASGPIDTDRRIDALTNEEIRIQRIASGDTGGDILRDAATTRRSPLSGAAGEPAAEAQEESPLVRAKARYAPLSDRAAEPAAAPPEYPPARPHIGAGRVIMILLLALFFLLLLWALVGILMSLHVLPALDLGYAWFDRVVFQLFGLAP